MASPVADGTSLWVALAAVAGLPFTLLAISLVSPKFDPREPAPLWPSLPLIGHVISLFRERSSFYRRLFKESSLPIYSLPMVTRKIYVVNSPDLISAAMKNADISFEPFLKELSARVTGLPEKEVDRFWGGGSFDRLMAAIRTTMKGPPLARMSLAALEKVSEPINAIGPGAELRIPDIWIWIRDTLGQGITHALFGEKNPFTRELYAELWTYEEGLPLLAQGLHFAAPRASAARRRIVDAMAGYYAAGHDGLDSVSDLMRQRAAIMRGVGCGPQDLGGLELVFPWVSSTNTVPTFLWFFINVFSRPALVRKIREEAEAAATIAEMSGGGRSATLDVKNIERECPHLGGAYRETLRLYMHNLGMRRVLKDTVVRDPESGREYLLRAGADVQWQSGVTHTLPSVWGDSWDEFDPARFIEPPPSEEKKRRGANIPFGGGKHLCPGRNFALAENLGFLAAIALGFEVEGAWVPPSEDPLIGGGVRRPVWGDGDKSIRLRRREGWEDVTWRFVS